MLESMQLVESDHETIDAMQCARAKKKIVVPFLAAYQQKTEQQNTYMLPTYRWFLPYFSELVRGPDPSSLSPPGWLIYSFSASLISSILQAVFQR